MSLSAISKEALDKVLEGATSDPNYVPGIIYSAINKEGEFIYKGASGVKSLNNPDVKVHTIVPFDHDLIFIQMTFDTPVFVASFTKLVTAIACLQLVEAGKVSLDDHDAITKHLPEVVNAKVVSRKDGVFMFTTPKNRITLRRLLNHTSGYGYTVSSIHQQYVIHGLTADADDQQRAI